MKVFVVGEHGPESNEIFSIHKTHKGALKAWNEIRLSSLESAKSSLKSDKYDKKIWREIIRGLSCKDPKKMQGSWFETPYIREYKVEA